MKLNILKKTRGLKDVWRRRASVLWKKPSESPLGWPPGAAPTKVGKQGENISDLSLSYFFFFFLWLKIRSSTCNRAVEVIQKFVVVGSPPPKKKKKERLTYLKLFPAVAFLPN